MWRTYLEVIDRSEIERNELAKGFKSPAPGERKSKGRTACLESGEVDLGFQN